MIARFTIPLILLTGFSSAQQPPRQPASMFTIGGAVVQHLTGRPIKHARVSITMNEHPDRKASLYTADDGRFHFTDVPEGKFTLAAEWHGQRHLYQQDDEQFSTGIVTGPGQDTERLVFAFPAPTHLDVDVVDEENEAVRSAQVFLFRRRIASGWPQIVMAEQGNTDAQGTAHFSHLQSGAYYVAVSGRPWYAQNAQFTQGATPEVAAELNVAYPVTYYGNVQDANAAASLQVAEGERAHAQIALRAVPAARITMHGLAENPGQPRAGFVQPRVEALGPGGIPIATQAQAFQAGDQWEISGFAPGNYVLSSSRFDPQGGMPRSLGTARVTAGADTILDAAEFTHTSVTGQLTMDGGDAAGMAVVLVQPATSQNAFCQVHQKNQFTCRGQGASGFIAPGLYEIRLGSMSGNGSDVYPKSISAQGARYQGGLLEIRDGASITLAIAAAHGLTNVNGIALDAGQRPVSGAIVLLVPQDMDLTKGIPRDQSDSDGTFTLPNVQPGRYYLVSIDHGHDLEYHNRQVLAPYLSRAQQLEIPLPGAVDAVRVQVQKR